MGADIVDQPKLSMKRLSEEIETLRQRLMRIEGQLEETLGEAADTAKRKMRELVGQEPVDDARREYLIREIAELKSRQRGDNQAITHWLEAEKEVDRLLEILKLRP